LGLSSANNEVLKAPVANTELKTAMQKRRMGYSSGHNGDERGQLRRGFYQPRA